MNTRKKGQSPILSHTIGVALSIVLISIVFFSLNQIRDSYQDFIAKSEMEQTCLIIKTGISKMYLETNYTSQGNTTMGQAVINLPEVIASQPYRTRFVNRTLFVNVDSINMSASCKMGYNASYTGFSTGGPSNIIWRTFSNGINELELMKK